MLRFFEAYDQQFDERLKEAFRAGVAWALGKDPTGGTDYPQQERGGVRSRSGPRAPDARTAEIDRGFREWRERQKKEQEP